MNAYAYVRPQAQQAQNCCALPAPLPVAVYLMISIPPIFHATNHTVRCCLVLGPSPAQRRQGNRVRRGAATPPLSR